MVKDNTNDKPKDASQGSDQALENKAPRSKKLVLGLWALVAIFICGIIAFQIFKEKPDPCPGAVRLAGSEDLGGDFEAVISDGSGILQEINQDDLIQGPTLIYFGYTFCPDVCPIDTARNAEITDILAERGIQIRPVFITVDPGRDTPEVMYDFAHYTHDLMVGVSGTKRQIDHLKELYKVYSAPNDMEDDPEFYTVDHSAYSYFMMPNGLVAIYARTQSAEEIADNMQCQLANWKS